MIRLSAETIPPSGYSAIPFTFGVDPAAPGGERLDVVLPEPLDPRPWRERLADCRARGYPRTEDLADARAWPTCKIGEEHRKHPDLIPLAFFLRDGLTH
jgi:hypothetical protein